MESYIDNSITKPTNIMHNITTLSPIPITKITRNDSGTDILWTEKEQRVAVIIAVALIAIITICVILIILRTLRKKSSQETTGLGGKGTYSCITNANQCEPKWNTQQQSMLENTSDRVRKVPTRNQENKKWYDSAAIPFMDEVSSSMDNLHTNQHKKQQI